MITLPAFIATFVAGFASCLAPCTVPLLPAYFATVSGISAADLADPSQRHRFRARLIGGSLLYVAGFTTVFVALGLTAGGLARFINASGGGRAVQIAGGVLITFFGLTIVGVVRIAWLDRAWRLRLQDRFCRRGVGGAYLIGIVFGLAWTPCVGPYLAAALTLAAVSAHATTGILLLVVYSFGLGLPFLLIALVGASLPDLPRRLTGLARPITMAGGLLTVALGIVLASGAYTHLTSYLVQFSTPH
jgi:cytochrome c-type biogenesis protein